MRLIDADKLQRKIIEMQNVYNDAYDHYDNGFQDAVSQIEDFVDGMATIEPKRGKWISCRKPNRLWDIIVFKCSICGCENYHDSLYCPSCGAEMREVINEIS